MSSAPRPRLLAGSTSAPALALALALAFGSAGRAQDAAAGDPHAGAPDWGMLESYCETCHNFEDWAGGVAFDTMTADAIPEDAEVWEAAVRKLRGHLMPPPGEDQPSLDAREAFIHAMEARLDAAAADAPVEAGYVPLHRLNRIEYANEIKALLDLDVDASDLLPPDFRADGFENVAEVLQVTPTFLDQYIAAARQVSLLAVGEQAPPISRAVYSVPQYANHTVHMEGLPLGTRDGVAVDHYFPVSGDYSFTIPMSSKDGSLLRSYPMGWLEYQHTFVLAIDDKPVFTADLGGENDLRAVDQHQQPAVVAIQDRFKDIRLPVTAGSHHISAAFIARTFAESDDLLFSQEPGEGLDDIPVVVRLEVLGPFDAETGADTPSRRKIFSCHPDADAADADKRACAEAILTRLATQAYRRPATHEDVAALMGFYDSAAADAGFETGVQKALMAMLASTNFLYRREAAPDSAAPGQTFAISDIDLATRLSFFLWSRGPDEELLDLAEQGRLSDPQVRAAQVSRMLADPRAETLVTNFAFQWLDIDSADSIDPDPRLYPEFDPDLRTAFRTEIKLFIDSVLREDHSVIDLLDADYSFVNERLARHYGLEGVRGSAFRRVTLADSARWGVLGKGGILMQRSYPNRTSPVRRGSFILEQILGTPPASPPPGVDTDLSQHAGEPATTVRARLERHRADASCNQCHGVIDPLGLALENFDAVGGWRDKDLYANEAIDAASPLSTGEILDGPDDLRAFLLSQPDQFVQTFTEKLMTYALGRPVDYRDMPTVRAIVRGAADDDYRFSALVQAVAASPQFNMKTVPAAVAEGAGAGRDAQDG